MLEQGRRWRLLDPAYRAIDRQGRWELACLLWWETSLERVDRFCQWCAARPLTTYAVWAFWLSFLYFALGPISYVKVPDCGNGTLPSRILSAQQFLQGNLGYWMDYSGCGTDRVLNNFRLEPLCILLALLPPWLGYGLIMLIQRFIAGYFFFRVTRDDLKFDPIPALLTGLAYSLFFQVGIHWQWDGFTLYDNLGIPGLPLLFWLTNRLVGRSWLLAVPGATAMGVTLALSAPYFQTLFFPFLAVFWYTFIQRDWTWKRFALLACVFVGWAVITAPEAIAAARYVPLSHRQEIVVRTKSPYVKYIENVQHWPVAVAESNAVYLAIAGAALVCSRFRDRRVVATCVAIGGILWFVSRYYFFNDHFLSHLGILSSFHFHRFIYLVPFLCALALGLGLMAMPAETVVSLSNRDTGLKLNVPHVAMFCAVLFLAWKSADINFDRWKQMWRGENYTSLYRHPDLLALAERRKNEPDFRVACVSDLWREKLSMTVSHRWTHSPGVVWAYGLETTDGYQVLYSLRYKQFWSEVLYPLFCIDEVRTKHHIYWGNMVFLWHPADDDFDLPTREYYNLNLLSLTNTKYIIAADPLNDPSLKLLPSAGRDEYEVRDDWHTMSRFIGAFRGQWAFRPLYIYENVNCMPRYFLARNVTIYDNADYLVSDLRDRSLHSLRHSVSVCSQDIPPEVDLAPLEDDRLTSCEESIGDVTVVSRTSDRLELEFTAAQPCVLFLSHTWHPGWRATLDGQATAVFPANHAFQGVHIPAAGKHRVVLTYHAEYAPSFAAAP
jgi:hypothetical protein